MELFELIGEHILSGIEEGKTEIETWRNHYETAYYVKFTLDGKTYSAIEDPDDGYRSYMGELKEETEECEIKLPNIEVECRMKPDDENGSYDVLIFKDIKSKNDILEIGTDYSEDYYPCCVLGYYPEKMYCNRERVENG